MNDIESLSRDLNDALLNASNDAAQAASDAEEIAVLNAPSQALRIANVLTSAATASQSSSSTNRSVIMCEIADSISRALLNASLEDVDEGTNSTSSDDWNTINDKARVWLEGFVFSKISYADAAELSRIVAQVVADMTSVAHTVPRAAIDTYASHAAVWETRRESVADVLYVECVCVCLFV